jgi:hypothetical protein
VIPPRAKSSRSFATDVAAKPFIGLGDSSPHAAFDPTALFPASRNALKTFLIASARDNHSPGDSPQ